MDRNRLFLVMQHEYLSIVAKKSFIVTTILVPIIMIAFMAVPIILSEFNKSDARLVAVVDRSGQYGNVFEDNEDYTFKVMPDMEIGSMKGEFDKADGDIYAFLVIPANVDSMTTVNVYSEKPIKMSLSERIEECLNASMTDNRIASYNIPELNNIISACKVNVNVKSHTWNEDGEESVSSSEIALITGLILAFMTYMFVLMYGAMIMGSVVEEKTNRIVEVIVSSCRPIELMLGKILGVALVGLTQIAVWVVLVSIVSLVLGIGSTFSATDMTAGAIPDVPQGEASEIIQAIMGVNWVRLIGVFVLYFIGGYLLYASLFAAFGSAVDQQSDANQYTMPVMMIIIIAMVVGQSCMENPDGQLGVVCSLIPFTSPIVMMIRLPYEVPAWQIVLSLGLLYGIALLLVYLASRIYRIGILMYGRKVSFKDMLRWLK